MRAFSAAGDGRVNTEIEPVEAAVLTQLANQVTGLLSEKPATGAVDGGIMAQLLPNAYPDDPEAAAEFRRFTEAELIGQKVLNARTIITDVADALVADRPREMLLEPQSIQAWLRSLTDIRLVLATRLGDDADGEADADADAEVLMLADIYDWLGWLQDSLVNALEE